MVDQQSVFELDSALSLDEQENAPGRPQRLHLPMPGKQTAQLLRLISDGGSFLVSPLISQLEEPFDHRRQELDGILCQLVGAPSGSAGRPATSRSSGSSVRWSSWP